MKAIAFKDLSDHSPVELSDLVSYQLMSFRFSGVTSNKWLLILPAPNPQAINMRGYPGTTPPPSVGVPGATMSGADSSNSAVPPTSLNAGFGSAAAAAAAVLAAANSSTRFGSPSQSPLEQPHGQSFMPGPHDLLLAGKGPLPGNSTPEAGAGGAASASGPSLHDAAMMGNAETGRCDVIG